MALYSIVFLGSTPIGAPLVGWLAELAGPRSGLYAGAAAALAAAAYARYAFARAGPSPPARRAHPRHLEAPGPSMGLRNGLPPPARGHGS